MGSDPITVKIPKLSLSPSPRPWKVDLGLPPRPQPPKMIALDSTAESITWMLSELDPKINIDKYQVSYHVK